MLKLDQPTYSLEEIYTACVDTKNNGSLKSRLLESKSIMQDLENEYLKKGTNQDLHLIREHLNIGNVTKDEMKSLYEDTLLISVKGRPIYNELISLPDFGICPLCSHGMVHTLDHYLPKSKFPGLAVTPNNLVPACRDCNTGKLAESGLVAEDMTLHPYFDQIGDYSWLMGTVVEKFPIVFEFQVNKTCDMEDLLLKRTESHFKSFSLAQVYTAQAGAELRRRTSGFIRLYNAGGAESVRRSIEESYYTYSQDNGNSWQTAMYYALLNSDWFFDYACSKLEGIYKL